MPSPNWMMRPLCPQSEDAGEDPEARAGSGVPGRVGPVDLALAGAEVLLITQILVCGDENLEACRFRRQ